VKNGPDCIRDGEMILETKQIKITKTILDICIT